jgi:hypothetical protein
MRMTIRAIGLWAARTFGSRIRDFESGEDLGKAIIVPWRGKIHIIGLTQPVRVVFLPQTRLTYWKQELGFTTHPPPDFTNERSRRVLSNADERQ